MLVELRVTGLGVIEDQTVLLGPGLTALTGETGAGKTLLVDAIDLLTGGAADPTLVSAGATEARVEGRFAGPLPSRAAPDGDRRDAGDRDDGDRDDGDGAVISGSDGDTEGADEIVLTRVIPAGGRSRCYVDGRMVSLAQLSRVGRALVDIHGQHAHQSLLSSGAQRAAVDRAGGIDTTEVAGWRRRARELTQAQDALGGDPRERARQIDLLSYQLGEIEAAALDDPDEDRSLLEEEELLADAAGLVDTARSAWEALAGDEGLVAQLGAVVSATSNRRPLSELHGRLTGLQEELADVAADARRLAESVEDDPARLAWIGERRRTLTELRRKYGGTLEEVIGYRAELRRRVDELARHDQRAAELEAELDRAAKELAAASERLWKARRAAAPDLARAVEEQLRALAMPRARFDIEIGGDPGDESVTWLLGANPGQPMLPLAKVASGGELSRAMLATRLVMGPAHRPAGDTGEGGGQLEEGPATLIFDEVDAGIGGEAAVAVGRALADIASGHQVLVVTHLAQVAAFANSHLTVAKEVVSAGDEERTVASARPVEGEDRIVELARMLSGRPDSESARRHAEELLAGALPDRTAGVATGSGNGSDTRGRRADPSPNSGRRRR